MTGNGPSPYPPPPVLSPQFDLYRQGYRDGYADALSRPYEAITPDRFLPPPSMPFVPHPDWIPLRHVGNGGIPSIAPICGEVSHYLIEKVSKYDPADLSKMRKSDGTVPSEKESPVCGFCHVPINPYSTRYLDYTNAFLEEPPHAFGPAVVPSQPPEIADITKTLMQIEEDLVGTSVPPPHRRICGRCGELTHEGFACGNIPNPSTP